MQSSVLTAEQARKAAIEVIDDGRGSQAVHDTVTALRANRRLGTACAKTRAEVSGNNKKIYRQKGTGGARHGDKRAPIFVKGGVVFGPRPRDYSKKVTKSTRRLALLAALSARINAGDVLNVETFAIASGKTKDARAAITAIAGTARRVLVIAQAFDDATYLAARNLANVLLVTAADANVEQIVTFTKIIVAADALPILAGRTIKP
jgi:large subunit ribosomal protein L4